MGPFIRVAAVMLLPLLGPAAGWAAEGKSAAVPLGPVATAAAFLGSMGISVHWEMTEGPYARRTEIAAALVRLGIRHVRGFDPAMSPPLAAHGITATLPAGPELGGPETILRLVRRANADGLVIDTVEGPNEADLFWPMHHYTYNGEGFPAGVVAFQRDLYAAFKATADTARILMIGPSLGGTYDPGAGHPNPLPPGSVTGAVDFGNFHPYPFGGNSFSVPFPYDGIERYYWHGNFPSANMDAFPYEKIVYAPPFAPKPMAATETGYPTWADGITEAVQAAYLPRLFAEYFRLGIQRTYLYELADVQPDPGGRVTNDHFGIIRSDLTPKPGFAALRSLIVLIGNGARQTVKGTPPEVSLTAHMPPGLDRTEFVHSLLLRVTDTNSLLLVWHEIADADTSVTPPRTLAVPDGTVDVAVGGGIVDAWYSYGTDWTLHRHPARSAAGVVTVPLQDRIVAVSLMRADKTP